MCDSKGSTLTVILSGEGQVFGGFTSIAWKSTPEEVHAKDTTAFIYSLTSFAKCNKQLNDHSVITSAAAGPTFGYNDVYGYDLQIVNDCNTANNTFFGGNTYELPAGADSSSYLAGGNDYTVKDIEVYQVAKS